LKKNRLMIIGLDAATFDLIQPWVDKGQLPNISGLFEKGVRRDLRSVPNLNSIPAWTTFATGKNPGKHGAYWFYRHKKDSYEYEFLNGGDIKEKRFWEIAGDAGLRVGVINVPMTYPSNRVNGFIISGLDAPSETSEGFTYPTGIYDELKENLGGYHIDTNILGYARGKKWEKAVEAAHEVVDFRLKAAKHLYGKEKWDLFVVVFTVLDRIQHTFWKFHDPKHPEYDAGLAERFGTVLFDFYKKMDDAIGELLALADDETVTLILSDHGMGYNPQSYDYLDAWLEKLGLLAYSSKDRSIKRKMLKTGMRVADKALSKRARKKLMDMMPGGRAKLVEAAHRPLMDWSRTKAYTEYINPCIWINVEGRDPEGIVEPGEEYEKLRDYIREQLLAARDVRTGKPVVEWVRNREDVYSGPYLDQAPDLALQWKFGEVISGFRFTMPDGSEAEVTDTKDLVERRTISGDHRPLGIFIVKGPGVKEGASLEEASIADVAPTALHILGMPVPEDMDGRVQEDIFTHEFLEDRPVRAGEASEARDSEFAYTQEEEEKIRKRLEGLGYLD
jgi:predicted AlkP superfamily phosphohydrolase/phosphomutase